MSDHNFYDSLVKFAGENPLRLHMPGHKGKKMPMEEWNALSPLDFTELTPTGNLYGGDDWRIPNGSGPGTGGWTPPFTPPGVPPRGF